MTIAPPAFLKLSRAISRPYSSRLLENSGVSGELMYFAVRSSASCGSTRPPKAIGRERASRIENITRPRNQS